jgi:hypothetical protein
MILMIDNYGERGFREALLRARERHATDGVAACCHMDVIEVVKP